MFYNKFIIIFSAIQQVVLTNDQALPSKNNDEGSKRNNPTTSYYQRNVFGPNTYAFGYEVNDKATGNIQFRDERRYTNGTIDGSHGYLRPDGSMMVTHFFADAELGYVSESQSFEPGEEPAWKEIWSIQRRNKSTENPDDKDNTYLTSILLPVEPIQKDSGIDLNPPALEKELINPAVLEVIGGEPLLLNDTKKNSSLIEFETISKFIPPEFPIVPFELPSDDFKLNINEGLSETPIPVLNKTNTDKTNTTNSTNSIKLLESNSMEKSIHTTLPNEMFENNGLNNTHYPADESDWYDKVINRTRQEYLEALN